MGVFTMDSANLGIGHMILSTVMTMSFLGGSLILLLASADLVTFVETVNTRSDVTEDLPCHFPNIVQFTIDDSYDHRGDPSSYNTIRAILYVPSCIGIVLGVVCAYGLRVTRGDGEKSTFPMLELGFRLTLFAASVLFVCGNIISFLYVMETECGPINYATHPSTMNHTEPKYNLDTTFGEPRHVGSSDIISNKLNEELNSIYDLATAGFATMIGGVLIASLFGVFHREDTGGPIKSTPTIWAQGHGSRFYVHVTSHFIEWLFRLLIVIFIGIIFGFWGADPDGGCSYDVINDSVPHARIPLTVETSPGCNTISSPHACMAHEHMYHALYVSENGRHPFSGSGTCIVTDSGHFDFVSLNASDSVQLSRQVCGYDVDAVVPNACDHWEASMYEQVIDSFTPAIISDSGAGAPQPNYAFSVPGLDMYEAPIAEDNLLTQEDCWKVVKKMFKLGSYSAGECGDTDDLSSLACQLERVQDPVIADDITCCMIYVTNQMDLDLPTNAPSASTSPSGSPSLAPTRTKPPSMMPTSLPTINPTTLEPTGSGDDQPSIAPTVRPSSSPTRSPTVESDITTRKFYDQSGYTIALLFQAPGTDGGFRTCTSPLGGTGHVTTLVSNSTTFNADLAIASSVSVVATLDTHYEIVKEYAEECNDRIEDGAYDSGAFEVLFFTAFVFLLIESLFVVGSAVARIMKIDESDDSVWKASWYYVAAKSVFFISKLFCFIVLIFLLNQNRHEGCPRYGPSSNVDGYATSIGALVFVQYISLFAEGMSRLAWPGTHDADGGNASYKALMVSML